MATTVTGCINPLGGGNLAGRTKNSATVLYAGTVANSKLVSSGLNFNVNNQGTAHQTKIGAIYDGDDIGTEFGTFQYNRPMNSGILILGKTDSLAGTAKTALASPAKTFSSLETVNPQLCGPADSTPSGHMPKTWNYLTHAAETWDTTHSSFGTDKITTERRLVPGRLVMLSPGTSSGLKATDYPKAQG
jgi:hypothetical protein